MNYGAHLVVTLVGLGLIMHFFLGGINPALLGIATLSAIMPDVDHDDSKGRLIVNAAVAIFTVWIAISGALLIALLLIVGWFVGSNFFVEHRGHFHSLIAAAVFGAMIAWALGFQEGIWAAIGYCAHLLEDMELKIW